MNDARLVRRGFETPIGAMHGVALESREQRGLCVLTFGDARDAHHERSLARWFPGLGAPEEGASGVMDMLGDDLVAYWADPAHVFTTPLALRGTEFQRRVWDVLLGIPSGQTRSYGEIARAMGDPGASRAVGAANGANPVAVLVACHRVIDSQGKLHGYAGGLDRKRRLLEHERSLTTALF